MKLGKWGGINVYIHWTFWLLIAFYLVSVTAESGPLAAVTAVAFVLSVFACVVLHEYGHAGAAAYFGIPTLDITLLPIGGVARLQRLPEKPYQELIIALAGPAVNFVIAGLLLPLLLISGLPSESSAETMRQLTFTEQLFAANLILALFNLLPAFPMDGGRVLRSLLAMRVGQLRATEIAARGGRWMAFLFGVMGIYYMQFGLILLAMFIFIAGTAELFAVRVRAMGRDLAGQGIPPQSGFGSWQVRAWPSQTPWPPDGRWDSYSHPGAPGDSQVVDADEVRELPIDRPPPHNRLPSS